MVILDPKEYKVGDRFYCIPDSNADQTDSGIWTLTAKCPDGFAMRGGQFDRVIDRATPTQEWLHYIPPGTIEAQLEMLAHLWGSE